mmetsp:Transcript_31021/g.99195  ORF Transcript_31021/g.99195 Transcript_31021/m.99195 type:complete len:271 (+) Transcript_31021:492-1304(+)
MSSSGGGSLLPSWYTPGCTSKAKAFRALPPHAGATEFSASSNEAMAAAVLMVMSSVASPKTANGALAEVDDAAATGGAAGASSQKMPNEAAAGGEGGAGGASSQKMPKPLADGGGFVAVSSPGAPCPLIRPSSSLARAALVSAGMSSPIRSRGGAAAGTAEGGGAAGGWPDAAACDAPPRGSGESKASRVGGRSDEARLAAAGRSPGRGRGVSPSQAPGVLSCARAGSARLGVSCGTDERGASGAPLACGSGVISPAEVLLPPWPREEVL